MDGGDWRVQPPKSKGAKQVNPRTHVGPSDRTTDFTESAEDNAEGFLLSDSFHNHTGFAHLHLLFPGLAVGTFPKSTTDEPTELSRIKFPG